MTVDEGKATPTTFNGQGLADEAIRQQLMLILASPEFRTKASLASFLRFVIEETLAGHAHHIKGYTIATQALGRKESFDAVKDPTVRILAGRMRKALERYYFLTGSRDPIRIEVPKGTYVPVFHHNSGCVHAEGLPSPGLSKSDVSCTPAGPGIAVMPLINLSRDPEQEYFVDGLTEELTAEIARYQDLRVVARHSTMVFKEVRIDAGELGRKLNVRFFLEGSVRREGNSLKVFVRLIDTSTHMQIWGEQYRRDINGGKLIELQEEIAARVAGRIGGYVGVIPRKLSKESHGTAVEAPGSYDAFLRLHQYSLALSEEAFCEALEALERAHQCDPESGVVWAMLGNLYADNNTLWFRDLDAPMEKALEYAQKGALLEPQNQYVRTAVAYILFLAGERDAFFREAGLAIELNPNSPTHTAYMGWAMALYGEWERGLHLLEKGIELNPYYPGWFHLAPYMYHFGAGRYEEAYGEALRFQMPQLYWDPLLRTAALGQLDRSDEARVAVAELLRMKPDFHAYARKLVAFYVKPATLIDCILDGLRKAGLNL